ncbi:hypothetical protein TD95_003964 [Thielaviopsis punctulata]|uniref:BRCT domain-containing protein n=1 Tax=Thielaviopsis punctulata TaxID=72032 RepID=A0A0F4Z9K6_9PEZI|nr:hypothetical protein TD95_003964 [Thielaviopsis punctulata]
MPEQKPKRSINTIARAGVHQSLSVDVWNSSATGDQISDTAPGTRWRESRNLKLRSQFKSGKDGGARMFDTYGQGALDYNERLNMVVLKEAQLRSRTTVVDMLIKPGAMTSIGKTETSQTRRKETSSRSEPSFPLPKTSKNQGMFDGVVVYINGSTLPLISDHKLKQMLSENGALVSLHLARRKVTHVILGRTAAVGRGAGGGLAGSKIDREIHCTGGRSVRYVSVDWVLDSLKAGKRLPEAQFSGVKVAQKQQKSVYGMFKQSN